MESLENVDFTLDALFNIVLYFAKNERDISQTIKPKSELKLDNDVEAKESENNNDDGHDNSFYSSHKASKMYEKHLETSSCYRFGDGSLLVGKRK